MTPGKEHGIEERARAEKEPPMKGLNRHAAEVYKVVKPLRLALKAYISGDYSCFKKYSRQVLKIEGRADDIKHEIRENMPWGILMPVDKSFFLMALHEEDAILDHAEDLVVWLDMRRTKIPEDIAEKFLHYFDMIDDTLNTYTKLAALVTNLMEKGFTTEGREKVEMAIDRVQELEYEADEVERGLTRLLFSMEGKMDTLAIFHLIKCVYIADQIANHAENAAEKIREMLSK